MNLISRIESAENRLKQILEEFFVSVYHEETLPSHGLKHHQRVWSYAKELLLAAGENRIINEENPDSLIIAVYLHDIGMSVEPGVRHGRHSMNICKEFLRENLLNEEDFPGLLYAISNHDNKEYSAQTDNINLLTILSVADDLDAFGFTGIFRYLEIYIIRGIAKEQLGNQIRKNASKRYDHFLKTFGFSEELVSVHKKRYEILDSFFSEYEEKVTGYSGIIDTLILLIEEHKNITLAIDSHLLSDDPAVSWFFKGLKSELQ